MPQSIDDIWQFWGFHDWEKADDVIRRVDLNLVFLVDLILREKPTTLVQVGRKAAQLIRDHRSQIEDAHFLTCLYVTLDFNELAETQPPIPSDKPVILVEDTLHKGKQLARVLQDFKNSNIKVHKVFCYLQNESGVKRLVKMGLLKDKQVVSLFPSHNEKEYQEKAKQLHVYFRSRIEPTDSDICYNLYNINVQLAPAQLLGTMRPLLKRLFGIDDIEEVQERGLATNIKELTYRTADNQNLQELADKLFTKEADYKFHGLTLRFKINQRHIDSDFTMIVKIEADCVVNKHIKDAHCLKRSKKCMLNNYLYNAKAINELNKKDREMIKNIVCPKCLDILMSDYLLSRLNRLMRFAFKKKELDVTLKQKYRPMRM